MSIFYVQNKKYTQKNLKHVRGCQMSKLLSKLAKARKIHFFVNQGELKLIDAFFLKNMKKNTILLKFWYKYCLAIIFKIQPNL